ncbi:MAG: aldehyde dehydrogenase family protein [Gammaproteobacteria bacterium]|nr:aldehyde dehydrogenase family protein [Gammaproteobacteria bacterium]MDH3535475.1 aldehyde dehydrogenase family protein [Gammaproteobacteria bacterium]
MNDNSKTRARFFVTPGFETCGAGKRVDVIDPATLEVVGERLVTDADTIHAVIARANAAQQGWARLDAKTRASALHRIADRIERSDPREVAVLMTREMGKPYPESVGEIANCGAIFRYYAEMARDEAGKVAGTTQAGSFQFSRYHPLGVSVHILPFNFPVLLMCWTVAASLAAGNACIVKPAEATSLCTLEFMRHFEGLPAGLVSCLPGDAQVAQSLIHSAATHAVAFTGSVAVGCEVGAACARLMKPCVIENGGSDPMIISRHAPMDVAVAGSVTAAFHLSGQVCTSSERFFVVDEVHDEFVAKFAAMTRKLRIGNGMDKSEIGPLVNEAARSKVERLVDEAVNAGATLVCGGQRPPGLETGWFYEPTILTDVTPDMSLMHNECFGPVAAICRVADFETALERANDTVFGLGAAIFTTDLAEAIEASERLQAGLVWINNPLIDNDALPFGGWKMSGLGRELGRQGLDAFRRPKMVIIDHQPQIHDWWYPYPDDWFYEAGGRKLGD